MDETGADYTEWSKPEEKQQEFLSPLSTLMKVWIANDCLLSKNYIEYFLTNKVSLGQLREDIKAS